MRDDPLLKQVLAALPTHSGVALRLALWDGIERDLGPRPSVTVRLKGPGALRYLLPPSLGNLAEGYILTKLLLQPGRRLPDAGCGWGALAMRAASHFGARVVGITLSHNQHQLACQRVAQAGWQDCIEIRLQDYRDVTGSFDRISSVGMFEHVGLRQPPAYFRKRRELLVDGGLVLNHGITSSDPLCAPRHGACGRAGVSYAWLQVDAQAAVFQLHVHQPVFGDLQHSRQACSLADPCWFALERPQRAARRSTIFSNACTNSASRSCSSRSMPAAAARPPPPGNCRHNCSAPLGSFNGARTLAT